MLEAVDRRVPFVLAHPNREENQRTSESADAENIGSSYALNAPKLVPSIVPFRQDATGIADREASSLGVCAIVLLALQNRLRQQGRSLLQRRDESVQLGEAHPRHRHRDTQASNQFPIR